MFAAVDIARESSDKVKGTANDAYTRVYTVQQGKMCFKEAHILSKKAFTKNPLIFFPPEEYKCARSFVTVYIGCETGDKLKGTANDTYTCTA